MSYANILKEMGITESRTQDLVDAMKGLHRAICRLDMQQRRVFANRTLEAHLEQFAVAERAVNVAQLMYTDQLAAAMRRIDFDEFGQFAERLTSLVEEAAEVKLPGANTLLSAVSDLYKMHPRARLPLANRIINKALAHAQVHGCIDYSELRTRLTNKYVDEYRHLDSWEAIGTAKTLMSVPRGEESIDGYKRTLIVAVRLTGDTVNLDVHKALHDTYTSAGCACEYDCCGCVSSHVRGIRYLGQQGDEGFYAVKMGYTRNI